MFYWSECWAVKEHNLKRCNKNKDVQKDEEIHKNHTENKNIRDKLVVTPTEDKMKDSSKMIWSCIKETHRCNINEN